MNERIKLPDQEWLGYDPVRGNLHGYTVEQMHWFADRIVRECVNVCESMQLIGPYKEVQDATLKDAAAQIKEHFGVEE